MIFLAINRMVSTSCLGQVQVQQRQQYPFFESRDRHNMTSNRFTHNNINARHTMNRSGRTCSANKLIECVDTANCSANIVYWKGSLHLHSVADIKINVFSNKLCVTQFSGSEWLLCVPIW